MRELDPLVSQSPIARSGPAHIATVKTFDPPTRARWTAALRGHAAGERTCSSPRGRRARAPRASDERRAAALSRLRREDSEDADVPAHLRRRRRAGAHRGRQEETRRRVAVHARCARRRARAPRPGCARSRRRTARRRSSAASGASCIPCFATSVRSPASDARTRTRSSGSRGSHPSSSRRTSRPRRRSGSRRRSTRICERALVLREAGKDDKDVYRIHGHFGEPCPLGHDTLRRVDFEEHTITYCPTCQTGGKELKDRRLSRLLR